MFFPQKVRSESQRAYLGMDLMAITGLHVHLQALRAELQAAIVSEEQELQNLEAQVETPSIPGLLPTCYPHSATNSVWVGRKFIGSSLHMQSFSRL